MAEDYIQEAFKLDGDSAAYFKNLSDDEWLKENFIGAVEFINRAYSIDSLDLIKVELLGYDNIFVGQFKESLKYYKKFIERVDASGQISLNNMHRIGYVYWKNGYKEKADFYFNEQKKYCEESIKKKLQYGKSVGAYFDLAGVYAFIGEREKAYENLRVWARFPVYPLYMVTLIKNDPLFDSIRNESEFQQIVTNVESKYQVEHERVRKWLEEQGKL